MGGIIKQSTAHTFQFGPFIDDTDGKTAETALTIAYGSVFLSKHGAAAAAKADTTDLTGTGDSRGYYDCVLNTTDTNTVGKLKVMAHITGALPVWDEFNVLPANVYDSLVGGTDYLDTSLVQWLGIAPSALTSNAVQVSVAALQSGVVTATSLATGAITNAKFAASAIDATAIASNAISATKIATGAITNAKFAAGAIDAAAIADSAIDNATFAADVGTTAYATNRIARALGERLLSAMTTSGSLGKKIDDIVLQTGDSYARIGATGSGLTSIAQASVCTEARLSELDAGTAGKAANQIDIIQTDTTTDIPALIDALPTAAENRAEIDSNSTQLAAIVQDTGTTLDGKLDIIDGNVDSILTDTGTTIPGTITTLQGNVTDILADTGELQTNQGAWATATGFSTHSAADVWAVGTRALTDKAGFSLSSAGIDAIFDQASSLTLSFEELVTRTYEMINNRMAVNETSGDVTLRNIGNTGNIATGNVASSSGTTTRAELSWS